MTSAFLLALCGCSPKVAVRTETVTVRTPVYVALPAELLRTCDVSLPQPLTNGLLVEYAAGLQVCLGATNDKLTRIRTLQPRK